MVVGNGFLHSTMKHESRGHMLDKVQNHAEKLLQFLSMPVVIYNRCQP